jgi:ssDNA-binding Zn-finger/Zn-ribbon topoisomerase 1
MLRKEGWLARFRKAHDNRYGYDKIPEDITSERSVPIFCFDHNEYFMQLPRFHAKGHGCPKCARKASAEKCRYGRDAIIKLSRDAHPEIDYDYSRLSIDVKTIDKVLIGCPKCGGIFPQTLNDHIHAKAGCPKCGHARGGEKGALTKQKFIDRAIGIHNNKYDYSYIPDTIRVNLKVPILCKKHNKIFHQNVGSHLQGIGCPRCGKSISIAEDNLYNLFREKGLSVIRRYRGWINSNHEIDLFLPDLKIGIEYNGLAYHHSAKGYAGYKNPLYHREKSDMALSVGIRLYHFFEGTSQRFLENTIDSLLNHRYIGGSERYCLKKGIRYGIVQRDLCPFKEDSFFYRNSWIFTEWQHHVFYWKPGCSNGRNTFYISKIPKQGYRPIYTSGVWVFRES